MSNEDPFDILFSTLQAGRPMLPMSGQPEEQVGEPDMFPATDLDVVRVFHQRANDQYGEARGWTNSAWTEMHVPGFSKIPVDDMRKRINAVIKTARSSGIGVYPNFMFSFRFQCDTRKAPVVVTLKSPFTAG